MDEIYKIAKSIQRYLMGLATDDEKREVEEWLEKSERHRRMLDEYRLNNFQNKVREYDVFDQNKAFRRFVKSRGRGVKRRFYHVASAAAIVFVMLSVSFYFIREDKKSTIGGAKPCQVICPGGNQAVLVFGNGKKFVLRDSMECLMLGAAARIKVEGNQVCYSENGVNVTGMEKVGLNAIITPKGGEYKLVLADGTRVWINADSRLEFPERFQGESREVYLQGEAYFEVAKDVTRPFRVRTSETVVKVLGTSFNVQAYEGEVLRTTLVSGNVAVEYGGEEMKIVPGEQWILKDGRFHVEKVNEEVAVRWLKGDFAFDDVVLSDVFKVLERWYNIRVLVCNPNINAMKFTGVFPKYEDIDRVLDMIELATCTRIEIKGRTIMIYSD